MIGSLRGENQNGHSGGNVGLHGTNKGRDTVGRYRIGLERTTWCNVGHSFEQWEFVH